MTSSTELFCNTGHFIQPHDVIFNRLDFWHENNGKKVFYDSKEFEKALPTFQDIPIVFAKTHPLKVGQLPLEVALKEVDGRLCGTPQDIRVNNTGSPDLRGGLTLTDPEVDQLIAEGKAYMSSAFTGTLGPDGKLTDIKGNHILIYPADTGIFPNDPAALFLNQSSPGLESTEKRGQIMAEEKTDVDPSRELIANQSVRIEEQATLIANQKAALEEKDGIIAKKDELLTNQGKEIEVLKGQLQAIRDAEKAKERELLLNQYAPGVKDQFKDRLAELDDPNKMLGLILAMNQAQAEVKPFEEKKAEGKTLIGNQGKTDETDDAEAEAAWTASNVRF